MKSQGRENAFTVLIEKNLCVSGPAWFKPVLFQGQLYNNSLNNLDMSPLSDTRFANIFSQFVSSLFLLFEAQKFGILMKFSLSHLSLTALAFGGVSENSLPYSRSQSFSLCFLLDVL